MNARNNSAKFFKGDHFQNRYRITGTLETISPLHVGTGEEKAVEGLMRKQKKTDTGAGKPILVSTVLKDHRCKPLIPGSTLKGVMRHWLLSVLSGLGEDLAKHRIYTTDDLTTLSQSEQLDRVMSDFSWVELLFGTPFHEGKIEMWDAVCKTPDLDAPDGLLNWNKVSLTYIDTSVAIDPATGTAAEHLLYQCEVVPPGVKFEFNLTGQNLSRIELGLLFLAMQGFNSEIYPIQIGARGGRGYGRMNLKLEAVYRLDRSSVEAWVKGMIENFDRTPQNAGKPGWDAAGYFALPALVEEDRKKLVDEVKQEFKAVLNRQTGSDHVQ